MAAKTRAFTPDGIDNIAFDVHNRESQYSHFFQIKVPYQVTYQYCSGIENDDYMNSVTLSGEKSYLLQESYQAHNLLFHTRPQHYHDYYELMIVLDGVVTQKIESNEYKYPRGSCCLINRGLYHSEGFDTPAQIVFIGLSVDYIRKLFNSFLSSEFHLEHSYTESRIFRFIEDDLQSPGKRRYLDFIPTYQNSNVADELHLMTTKLIESLLFPCLGISYLVDGQICRILGYLASSQKYHTTAIELHQKNDFLLFSRVRHFMEERHGRVSRSELERTLNYSGDYLNRIVKKYSGESLFDFGMSFCIHYAAELLKNTTEPVSEISVQCGFSNKTHFYQWFKKIYHITPNEYRQSARTAHIMVSG